MYIGELEGEGHVSSSWMESEFDHYICLPALSLVGACGREVRRELVDL